jgi:hypothetical protein
MNNYQKLTLESFIEKLHAKGFKGIAGARRSIGKAEISKADREKAHLAINKFFGDAGVGPKTATKKTKTVKVAAPKAKKMAAPKVAKKMTVKAVTPHHIQAHAPQTSAPTGDERVMRQHAAATVINTLYGKVPMEKDLETKLLDRAGREYLANASVIGVREEVDPTPAVKSHERIARPRIPVQKPVVHKAAAIAVEHKALEPVAVAPENGETQFGPEFDPDHCTPEERRQWELLRDAKEVAERGTAS